MQPKRGGKAQGYLDKDERARLDLYNERTKLCDNQVVKRAIREFLDREFKKGVSK